MQNTGAAFGLLNAADFPYKSAVMIGIATLALVAISIYARQLGAHEQLSRYGLALILGGAFGNLIDRAIAGYVVDFVDVYWGEVALLGLQRRRRRHHRSEPSSCCST